MDYYDFNLKKKTLKKGTIRQTTFLIPKQDGDQIYVPKKTQLYDNGELGIGQSGSMIVSGIHKKSKDRVAVKAISKVNMSSEDLEDIHEYVNMFQIMKHPSVALLKDSFESNNNFYLVLELLNTCTLELYLRQIENDLTEEIIRGFALKIANLLDYLHNNGIIVRNLSASSFLMDQAISSDNLEGADFKLCRINKARVMGMKEY